MLVFHQTVLGFGKSAFFTRNPANPNWRQYEMAGISHLPAPILPLGIPNQNTADATPLFRAAFDNLSAWTQGSSRGSFRPLATSKEPWTRHMPSSPRRTPMVISLEVFDCLTSHRPSTDAMRVLHSVVTPR